MLKCDQDLKIGIDSTMFHYALLFCGMRHTRFPKTGSACLAGREIFETLLMIASYVISSESVKLIRIIFRNREMPIQNDISFCGLLDRLTSLFSFHLCSLFTLAQKRFLEMGLSAWLK